MKKTARVMDWVVVGCGLIAGLGMLAASIWFLTKTPNYWFLIGSIIATGSGVLTLFITIQKRKPDTEKTRRILDLISTQLFPLWMWCHWFAARGFNGFNEKDNVLPPWLLTVCLWLCILMTAMVLWSDIILIRKRISSNKGEEK